MQTHLWCARCNSVMEVELQLKKMRGRRAKLAQVLSLCSKCGSTLHAQTMSLEAAEEMVKKFQEIKETAATQQASEQEVAEQEDSERTGEQEDDET